MTGTVSTALLLFSAGIALQAVVTARPMQVPSSLTSDISELGSFDFATRTDAARRIRRAPPSVAIPVLEAAARGNRDSYVRFRSLVILSAAGDENVGGLMRDLIADRDDRVRTVVYQWFERHPDRSVLSILLDALPRELSEFVRPALMRAVAAQEHEPAVRSALIPLVTRGEDFFRGSLIRTLGLYRAGDALNAIEGVAKLDGPLQDDAIAAIAEIGDPSSLTRLVALQAAVTTETQPVYSASLCLLGVDCPAHLTYLTQALDAALGGQQGGVLSQVIQALSLLASHGQSEALSLLVRRGLVANDSARDHIALGVALVALRAPALMLQQVVDARDDMSNVVTLVRDGFDLLSEDFAEEGFYAEMRRAFWEAADGSDRRRAANELMTRLEF